MSRWVPSCENSEQIMNVKYTDNDLEDIVVDNESTKKVVEYGGVELTNNMREVLKMHPNFMTFKRIDVEDVEEEIEKGMTKGSR